MRPGEVLVLCSGNSASSTRAVCRQCETRYPACARSWHYLAILSSSHALLIRRYWKWLSWVRFPNLIPQGTGLFHGSKQAGLRLWQLAPNADCGAPCVVAPDPEIRFPGSPWPHRMLQGTQILHSGVRWCRFCFVCGHVPCAGQRLALVRCWLHFPGHQVQSQPVSPHLVSSFETLMIIGSQLDGQQMS